MNGVHTNGSSVSSLPNGASALPHSTQGDGAEGEDGQPGGNKQTFQEFAASRFLAKDKEAANFSRRDLSQPLLSSTPTSERKTCIAIWKTILSFMGDAADYRANIENSLQPEMGSVMSRLYKQLRIGFSNIENQRRESITKKVQVSDDQKFKSTQMSDFTEKGALHKLKASLHRRFFPERRPSAWSTLPLEETLLTPLDQIHLIAGYGILKPALRDEIYCQLCKQLNKNPFKTSIARGWLLMQLCLGCFLPSSWVLPTISNFIEEGPPLYATNCKKALKRTLEKGMRYQPPAFIEMDAGLHKHLLEVTVTLMDGTLHTVTIDASTTAAELSSKIAEETELQENFGFSIYISMFDKVASLGSGGDYILDSISQCEQIFRENEGKEGSAPWRLFYRKEMFAPWESTYKDPVAVNLIFSQVVRGIILGEYTFSSDQELGNMAAQQYYVEYGADISEEGLSALLPSYIPNDKILEDQARLKWQNYITKVHKKLYSNQMSKPSQEEVKTNIVYYAKKKWAKEFSCYHDVRLLEGNPQMEEDLIMAISSSSICFNGAEGSSLDINYMEISSVSGEGGPDTEFMILLVNGGALKFSSMDANDIRGLIRKMVDGLRQRSKYAVAVLAYYDPDDTEQSYKEGDLLILTVAAGKEALTSSTCSARNTRTEHLVEVPCDHIYVLPTIELPSDEYMSLFQSGKQTPK